MSQLERYYLDNLEKLYEQSLMKWGFDWLPATPPGTYLHSFDEFKQKILDKFSSLIQQLQQ